MSDSELVPVTPLVDRLRAWSETPFEGDPMIDALLTDVPEAADRIEALEAQVKALREALGRIYTYCNDTLSGRADGGFDDREWQRAAVIHARNVAREFVRPELHATLTANKIFTQPGAPS